MWRWENYCVLSEYHKWVLPLCTWMVGFIMNLVRPTILVRGRISIYGTLKVYNNFPWRWTNRKKKKFKVLKLDKTLNLRKKLIITWNLRRLISKFEFWGTKCVIGFPAFASSSCICVFFFFFWTSASCTVHLGQWTVTRPMNSNPANE